MSGKARCGIGNHGSPRAGDARVVHVFVVARRRTHAAHLVDGELAPITGAAGSNSGSGLEVVLSRVWIDVAP